MSLEAMVCVIMVCQLFSAGVSVLAIILSGVAKKLAAVSEKLAKRVNDQLDEGNEWKNS